MSDLTPQMQEALRKPFAPGAVQHINAGGTQLAYVGHATVTDRLLTVDPSWSWEPMALEVDGLPKFDEQGGLWIRLTVCGVTRIGYGEPQGRDFYDKRKGAIGNAIRVAAMRFGVGIDLWSKEKVEAAPVEPVKKPARPSDVKRWVKACEEATGTDALNAVVHELTDYAVTEANLAEVVAAGQAARARLKGGAA